VTFEDAVNASETHKAAIPYYFQPRLMDDVARAKFICGRTPESFILVWADTGRGAGDLASCDYGKTRGRSDWKPLEKALEDWRTRDSSKRG
jgi:hypothetical protein